MTTFRASIVAFTTFCCVIAVGSSSALAVTADQIVAMTRAGVSDAAIIALIEHDRSVFALDADQLVELQRSGVSEAVTVAMLRSGDVQADAEAPRTPAAAAPQAPDVVTYAVPVPVHRRHAQTVVQPVQPVAAAPQPASSARGIFFSRPATGIFFTPPAAADCPPPTVRPPRR